MKGRIICLVIVLLTVLTGCGQEPVSSAVQPSTPAVSSQVEADATALPTTLPQESETESSTAADESVSPEESSPASNILIAYFSRVGNTDFPDDVDAVTTASLMRKDGVLVGNTQYIAQLIQEHTGGNLFLIETAEKYPADYDETDEQGRIENRDRPRPELLSTVEDMGQYDIIFLGFPNWYYDMPMPVYSFLEEYDLSGKTIIPFATSGGGGFSNTLSAITEAQPGAEVLDGGFHASHSQVDSVQPDEVKAWLDGLPIY